MIANLNGKVIDKGKDNLVVSVGGLGFQVYIPAPALEQAHLGEGVSLFTYLVVREDSLTLYGFESREERDLYILLLSVNGVGPRLALAILSALTPDAIRRAVLQEQPEVFNRVPGIGMKTAQKIFLQLQDRIPAVEGIGPATAISDSDGEVLAALTALGYSVVEAQAALQSIPRDAPEDIEERLRIALQFFS